ncbi:MAG: hypothetical protein JXA21_07670 [Anaerolineae bacterium]|nr:hypothetical protein [Anaerolineae bacterium]
MDLPGIPLDAGVAGAYAYSLLSAPAIVTYAREFADGLCLPARYRDGDPDTAEVRREVPRYVDACLDSDSGSVRAAAEAVARRLGRNLGYILLTLHRGDAVNRTARADWSASEWSHWATIRRIWLGGGVLSGGLGRRLLDHSRALLAEFGGDDMPIIAITSHPRDMVLLGAVRYLPLQSGAAICCDFGQTGVKRALVRLDQGHIVEFHRLPTLPVVWPWRNAPDAARGIVAEAVRDFFVTTISRTLQESRDAGHPPVAETMLSVAAYVRGGELLGNGMYEQVMALTGDVRDVRILLADALALRGDRVRIHVIHDGTAAAAFHAGEERSAVLVVGTAIGVGFPPPTDSGMRPLTVLEG